MNAASAATVAVRHAVRTALSDLDPGDIAMVACSGGPDSSALAAATAFVAPSLDIEAGAVIVDHGLQPDSQRVAEWASGVCTRLGLNPAVVIPVQVGVAGGPEAAARDARYHALEAEAQRLGAKAVLLGHTREDQAETVLMRLARGSGARSMSAMAPRTGLWRRPLLDLPRSTVHACADEELTALGERPWIDPHNSDQRYTRVRLRSALGGLVDALGEGVVLGLSRTARLLRDDADALDGYAQSAFSDLVDVAPGECSCEAAALLALPRAVRTRVIRQMCLQAGSDAGALGFDHLVVVERLISEWHGQGPSQLPGVTARRAYGRLSIRAT